MAQEKQWWEQGYEKMNGFLGQPRPEFVNKKGDGAKENNFGLWKPDNFYVPLAKAPEKKKVKSVIFVADNPFLTRQHLGEIDNPKMPSGREWAMFSCGAQGDFYDPQIYNDLLDYAGKDKIPGNFAPCCGEVFKGTNRKGKAMPGHPQDVVYETVIDTEKWTDKKGKVHQFVMKLFPSRGDTIDKMGTLREAHGSLDGCMYDCIRFQNKQSSPQGEMIAFKSKGDLAKLFAVAMYSGRLISELFEEARVNSQFRDALSKIFILPTAPDGDQILNRLPTFNYWEILRPRPLDELRELFAKKSAVSAPAVADSSPSAVPGFDAGIPGFDLGTSDAQDDLPF